MNDDTKRTAKKYIVGALAAVGVLAITAVAVPGIAYAFGGPHFGHGKVMTEDDAKDYAEFFVKRFSKKIDADKKQQAALQKAIDKRIPELVKLHAEKRAIHKQLIAAVTAEKIDRTTLDTARKNGLDLADRASTLVMDTVMEVADILTPEQRAELAERMNEFHGGPDGDRHGDWNGHHGQK
jgi:Spy/CpxP family protein refolding chaperone